MLPGRPTFLSLINPLYPSAEESRPLCASADPGPAGNPTSHSRGILLPIMQSEKVQQSGAADSSFELFLALQTGEPSSPPSLPPPLFKTAALSSPQNS